MIYSFWFFFSSPELEPIIFVIQRVDKILYRKGFLHRDTFNPGEKSLGQYCYIHIFLSFSIFSCSYPSSHPVQSRKVGKKSGYTRPTLFVGLGEWRGGGGGGPV